MKNVNTRLFRAAIATAMLLAVVGCESDSDEADATADTLVDDVQNDVAIDTAVDTDEPDLPPDTTPPEITSTDPAQGATVDSWIPYSDEITFTASEQLDPSTLVGAITITLVRSGDGATIDIPNMFRFAGQWEIYPTGDGVDNWGSSGTYTVRFASTVADLAGNPLVGAPFVWTFSR